MIELLLIMVVTVLVVTIIHLRDNRQHYNDTIRRRDLQVLSGTIITTVLISRANNKEYMDTIETMIQQRIEHMQPLSAWLVTDDTTLPDYIVLTELMTEVVDRNSTNYENMGMLIDLVEKMRFKSAYNLAYPQKNISALYSNTPKHKLGKK